MENKPSKLLEWFKVHVTVRAIAANAIVAALYFVMTIAFYFLSYDTIQVRVSEMLCLLVFFNPTYTIGLTIGCFFANLYSTSSLDMLFGTAATLVSCLLMILVSKTIKNLFLTGLMPVLGNALIVPFAIIISTFGTPDPLPLDSLTYFTNFGFVALGEFIAILVIGYPIFLMLTKKVKHFNQAILATQNLTYKW